jgi:hypothetical protein
MEILDLTSLSPEQREKVMAIVNEQQKAEIAAPSTTSVMDLTRSRETPETARNREEYLAGIKDISKSKEYDNMDYDTKGDFNDAFYGVEAGISERRRKGQLTRSDKVIYKQLEIIHESGSPANFWNKVRGIVESKKQIDLSDVTDELDSDIKKLLNVKK